MTQQDREILVARMLERPSALTDAEIDAILGDEELLGIYNASAELRRAKRPAPEVDAAREWRRFVSRQAISEPLEDSRKFSKTFENSRKGWRTLAAAAVAGVMLFAGVWLLLGNHEQRAEIVAVVEPAVVEIPAPEPAPAEPEQPAQPAPEPKKRPSVKPMPVEPEESLDLDEALRVQQARMENDLALQRAEAMIEEYASMAGSGACLDGDMPDDNELLSITMQ